MVKYQLDPVGSTFAALSDPTRRALMSRLAPGEVSVSELAAPTGMTMPAVVKHLRVLERAGLVEGVKRGRTRWYRLRPGPLRDAAAWLAHYTPFWEDQLDSLANFIQETQGDR